MPDLDTSYKMTAMAGLLLMVRDSCSYIDKNATGVVIQVMLPVGFREAVDGLFYGLDEELRKQLLDVVPRILEYARQRIS